MVIPDGARAYAHLVTTALDTVAALGEEHEELAAMLAGLSGADWSQPTRCDGWTVADVVLHLAQTDDLAIASLEGHFEEGLARLSGAASGPANVDDGAAAMVARERGLPSAALLERWLTSSAALRALLDEAGARRRVPWVAGDLSLRTLAATRLAEAWIHAGDVAEAIGTRLVPAERLRHVARLAWRTLPYAFARAGRHLSGTVAFELHSPNGNAWDFVPEGAPATVIRGDGEELCLVAGRRLGPEETSLRGHGPDAGAVLALVRTYA